nr:patatin-like phospholipase family protein [Pontixanthobacter luteolus]
MYRAVVSTTLDDRAIERIADGPQFEVILGLPPQWLYPRLVAVFAGIAYQLDQQVRSTPHLALPRAMGMRSLRVDARQAAQQGRLVDLICVAATIPPVFDVPKWEGRDVLDGGMLDKAPLPQPDEGRTLVLLTRRYRNLPVSDRHIYVQPSKEVAADKIDFTDETKVTRTWEQGQRDARSWLGGGCDA